MALVSYAEASDRYHPGKLCPEIHGHVDYRAGVTEVQMRKCRHRVEDFVSRDVPGVVERNGALLRIRAKNGKAIQRQSSYVDGETYEAIWVCDYLPQRGYIRLCYLVWESSGTEFVNVNTGTATFVQGWLTYSPSGDQILMVDGYGGAVDKIEIWRFGRDRLVREFQIEPPAGAELDWERASWMSETEVMLGASSDQPGLKHLLSRKAGRWEHREQ